MKDRRKNNVVRESVEDALQRKDIESLTNEMRLGFKGMHDRQDTTNGKVLKANEDIVGLQNWKWFITGGLTIIAILILPVIFIIVKLALEKA